MSFREEANFEGLLGYDSSWKSMCYYGTFRYATIITIIIAIIITIVTTIIIAIIIF